jgi:3-deoxy-manno-octulosonate cytidylyltransferase (CMP-KDO synthetase)
MKYNILDCTLRDGGYYTNWNFDSKLVKNLVKNLDDNGVNIIELGYKSPIIGGPYRKCNDGFIKSIIDFKVNAKLAFMIDLKDYIENDQINIILLKEVIKNKKESPFTICRIAAKYEEIKFLNGLIYIITDLGYEVICNLMGGSTLTLEQIKELEQINCTKLYIADSYGNLYPKDIERIFKKTKLNGIHTHDNLGLAFANSITAIDNGAIYVDGTITGMGRGVGNTRTEQLIIYRNKNITPNLLDIIDEFNKIKQKLMWGHNPLYMLSALNNIHPLYSQELNQSNLNNTQIVNSIKELTNNLSYDPNKLTNIKDQKVAVVIPARYKSSRFPGKPLAKINGKEMILWVAEISEKAVGKKLTYIATENEEIASLVKQNGYNVILTSDNCKTGTDRVAEASLEIDADIIINIQGDEPMLDYNDILKIIEYKKQFPSYIINCMSNLNSDENINDTKIPKVVTNTKDELLYISRSAIPGKKTGISKLAKKQICIYAFNKNVLMNFYSNKNKTPLENEEDIEILRFLELGYSVKMLMLESNTYAVDYPEDIKIVENKLNSRIILNSQVLNCTKK